MNVVDFSGEKISRFSSH